MTFEPDCEGAHVGVEIHGPYKSYVSVHLDGDEKYAFPPDTSFGPLGARLTFDRCLALSCALRVAAYLIDGSLTLDENKQLKRTRP